MATKAQTCAIGIRASRRNAQISQIPIQRESTGPRTLKGKAAVSQNAIKSSLLSHIAEISGEIPARRDYDFNKQSQFAGG
jgi:hypothetical protein